MSPPRALRPALAAAALLVPVASSHAGVPDGLEDGLELPAAAAGPARIVVSFRGRPAADGHRPAGEGGGLADFSFPADLVPGGADALSRGGLAAPLYAWAAEDDIPRGKLHYGAVYEPGQTSRLRRVLDHLPALRTDGGPAFDFLDIGANIGWFTMLAASSPNVRRVLSIEAAPFNAKLMSETLSLPANAALKKKVTVLEGAAGNPTAQGGDTLELWWSKRSRGEGSLMCAGDNEAPSAGADERNPTNYRPPRSCNAATAAGGVNVTVFAVDDMWEGELPLVVKVDVEGAELHVLEGMRGLFSRRLVHHVSLEAHGRANAVAVGEKMRAYQMALQNFESEAEACGPKSAGTCLLWYTSLAVLPVPYRDFPNVLPVQGLDPRQCERVLNFQWAGEDRPYVCGKPHYVLRPRNATRDKRTLHMLFADSRLFPSFNTALGPQWVTTETLANPSYRRASRPVDELEAAVAAPPPRGWLEPNARHTKKWDIAPCMRVGGESS